jgi:hypothetical protein
MRESGRARVFHPWGEGACEKNAKRVKKAFDLENDLDHDHSKVSNGMVPTTDTNQT